MSTVLGRRLLALTFLAVLVALVWWARSVGHPDGARPPGPGGMAVADFSDLPPEAVRTMALIVTDGPFPFPEDGRVYDNDELLLPYERAGYYREYSVARPGSQDRGPLRLVKGSGGELYYSRDGDASFSVVVGGPAG